MPPMAHHKDVLKMSKMPLNRIRAKAKLAMIAIRDPVTMKRTTTNPRCTLTTLPHLYHVLNVHTFNALHIYALRTTLHNLSWGEILYT